MSATEYTYSIQNDFPNHKVAPDRLTQEIQQSAVATALDHIDTVGDDCDIWFKAALSSGDETILDGIVATHSGEPLPQQASPVRVVTPAGKDVPSTSDGRTISASNGYPIGTVLQVSGCGDDPVLGRGKGEHLFFANKTPGDYELEWKYNDSVWLAGGGAFVNGSDDSHDNFTMDVYCPATPITPNVSNTGNCNVTPQGVVVPAAGNGAFDVDLAQANPVPAPGGLGYWDWDFPDEGRGTTVPSAPGAGNSLLIAADLTLEVFAPSVHFVGSTYAPFVFPNVVASHVWPFWKMRLKLHVESASVDFSCHLILARHKTT